ncbi:hypothetical protein [[Kitasatospora] papulosa]|uniref:hypothetical protein n=1 Tax=[Kitasatospora] papulosa TaxID=1464011 RepID=UPI003684F076
MIEMCGFFARTEGLDEEALHIVAGLTGADPQEIVRVYRRENTSSAQTQTVLDAQGLTNLDAHHDGIGQWGCHRPSRRGAAAPRRWVAPPRSAGR